MTPPAEHDEPTSDGDGQRLRGRNGGDRNGGASPQPLGLAPTGRVEGELLLGGSKSLAQRALIAAGLASGTTRITRVPQADDVRAATRLIQACGASVRQLTPAALEIQGLPPGPHRGWSATEGVDAGESGTLARLATAALAFCGRAGAEHVVRVSGTLARRSSPPLFAALERADVGLASERPGGWPVRLTSVGPPPDVYLDTPVSSQELSGLLISLAAWPGTTTVHVDGPIPSRPYVDMTRAVLADFGVRVDVEAGSEAQERFVVRGPLEPPAAPLELEPDASSAAVALAAACLSGGELRVPGLGRASRQGDVRIVEYLRAFGCQAEAEERALVASGAPSRAAELDLSEAPDLAPVLAAVAARVAHQHGQSSTLVGLGTLPGKESSRIDVLATGLRATGLEAVAGSDRLRIGPPNKEGATPGPAAALDPHGDHRMAFAFALVGLIVPGVRVDDPGCVAKSWPGFWEDLAGLGAHLER